MKKEPYIKKSSLSDETIKSLRELGEVLMEIHLQLLADGYKYENGKFIEPNESKEINQS